MPLNIQFAPDGSLILEAQTPQPPPLPDFEDEITPLPPSEFVTHGDTVRQAGTLGEEDRMIALYRQKMERDLFTFNYTIMGGSNILQKVPHGLFCDFLQSVPPKRKLLLAPRGHLKTTLAGGLALHFFIQPPGSNRYFPHGIGALGHNDGRSTRVLMASKSLGHASDRLSFIRTRLETNPLFYGFWPHIFWEKPRRESKTWNDEEILLKREDIFVEPSIKCIGVGGQITGYHFNVQMHDDIIDDKDRYSAATMKTAFDWFVATRMLMDNINESLEITTGTHWANNDVYTLIRENDSSVDVRAFSALVRGAVESKNGQVVFSKDCLPLWPEGFPLQLLQDLASPPPYGVGELFPLCYLNDPYHSSVVDFNPNELRYYDLEDNIIYFEDDERDIVLNQVFGRPEPFPLANVVKGMRLDREGYEALRERLRDRDSKIYFNGR